MGPNSRRGLRRHFRTRSVHRGFAGHRQVLSRQGQIDIGSKETPTLSILRDSGPLLTRSIVDQIIVARDGGASEFTCSLDLQRSTSRIAIHADYWVWRDQRFPYPQHCRDRTIYHWENDGFRALSRYTSSLVKLIPTDWGPPTFEIDGIKMLPTATVSPYADAERKVGLIQPNGKVVLDTCGGLGYFAAWCIAGNAARIISYEKSPDVLWLRSLNPWSPPATPSLQLNQADITEEIGSLPTAFADAITHDPPRFGTAGELYSQAFYCELARVLRRKGKLFHYVGSPNKLTTGRDVTNEVSARLRAAGFKVTKLGDGIVATRE